jgi:hypothetical protein
MLIGSHLNQLFSTDSAQSVAVGNVLQLTQTLAMCRNTSQHVSLALAPCRDRPRYRLGTSWPLRRVESSLVVLLFIQTFTVTYATDKQGMQRSVVPGPFS